MTAHDVIVQLLGNTFGTGDEYARDILGALKAAGYAVVELPKPCPIPNGWSEECLGAWPGDDRHAPISAWPDKGYGMEVADHDANFMTAERARSLAGALLAAAAAAEVSQ